MRFVKSFYMALGMFTAIPLPFHIWDEKLATVMVAQLPLIGLLIGAIWWGSISLLVSVLADFNLPVMVVSALLTVAPFLVAGFIHLDGYMDTSDALLSYRPMEDKLRILKDPTVGAFAVVMLVILFFLQFASVFSVVIGGRYWAMLIVICVISRGCSALAIFMLRHMPASNYAAMLGDIGKEVKAYVSSMVLIAVGFAFFYAGFIGLIVSAAVILGYTAAMRKAYKGFDGVSGDLLGYSMVIGELCGLITLALLQGVII